LFKEVLLMKQMNMWIDGEWSELGSNDMMGIKDPATLEAWAVVPNGGKKAAEEAVNAASAAFPKWKEMTAFERGKRLRRWHELMIEHKKELAETMTREQGKPFAEAEGEIEYAASFLEWYAEEGKRVFGDTMPSSKPGKRLFAIRQPVGVVAAATPWNFPAAMIARKAAPALAAGCTFVVKPAGASPLTALYMAELSDEAGIPPGVFNVVTGEPKPTSVMTQR
jgi:succinate-semialdehyde dehydrogenase/glutarate-semialdehyde dehydrogenase